MTPIAVKPYICPVDNEIPDDSEVGMEFLSSTAEVFHELMSWSNDFASRNMSFIFVTADVSHELISWSNDFAS